MNCQNKLFLIKIIIPLVLKEIETKELERFTSQLIERYYELNELKNLKQLKQPNLSQMNEIHKIILICLGRPMYKQKQITVSLSNDLILMFLKEIINGNVELSEIVVYMTYSQENFNQFKECFNMLKQTMTIETIFKTFLSKPLAPTAIPIFIHFISFENSDEITLMKQIELLHSSMTIQNAQNIQNCIMSVVQGLLAISQSITFQTSTFEFLLHFLSPNYPPALINAICAIVYNSSLFAYNFSPLASNQLISSFIFYSSPNQMISNNFNVFKMLGKTIHRLLHNKNVDLVYSLVNSLSQFQQIRKYSLKDYQLPEAYKQWNQETLENELKESKIDVLVSFGEKWLPKLLNQNIDEKDLIMMKLSDEISTDQLQIDFNPLLDWSKTIWFKEMSVCYKDLYWNKI